MARAKKKQNGGVMVPIGAVASPIIMGMLANALKPKPKAKPKNGGLLRSKVKMPYARVPPPLYATTHRKTVMPMGYGGFFSNMFDKSYKADHNRRVMEAIKAGR